MMVKDKGEVVVIGGGPAGYVASIRAAQLGGEVILIDVVSLSLSGFSTFSV